MGSIGNPSNPNWPPYNGYRDCSQGICSIYCPQWCYLIFPPPPPAGQSQDDNSGMNFSPLIIVVIGILASAFLLVSYYTIISKYCKRRGNRLNPSPQSESWNQLTNHDQWQHATAGLDESLIKSIAACKYTKGGGLVDGSDCAVCLCEFQEGETLRLLPKCGHAFHLYCIDTWLRSHSSCPLCRSHVMPGIPIPFQRPPESQLTSSDLNISSLEFHRRNDLVVVVEETQRVDHRDVAVAVIAGNVILPKYPFHERECNVDGMSIPMNMGTGADQDVEEIRRSTSLGSSVSCQNPNLLIADILRTEEDYDDDGGDDDDHHHIQVGPYEGENSKSNKISNAMKRSVSTGRFMFTRDDKGKNSILPD